MLSILIPIYQQDVTKLVFCLENQLSHLETAGEIICLDDGSDQIWKTKNQILSTLKHTQYEELTINVGRSVIRNKLAEKAKYPLLLFLDGDSEIVRSDFLFKYLQMSDSEQVIIGGRIYPKECPAAEVRLHWTYGVKREENAREGFQSNNFLVPAPIFEKVRFSELVEGYGHEDTLFGFDLHRQGFKINHIDNPVLHAFLDSNETFLAHQIDAIKNLKRIRQRYPLLHTRLTSTTERIDQLGLRKIITNLFGRFSNDIHHHLMGPHPRMWLFDFFKIGTWFTTPIE